MQTQAVAESPPRSNSAKAMDERLRGNARGRARAQNATLVLPQHAGGKVDHLQYSILASASCGNRHRRTVPIAREHERESGSAQPANPAKLQFAGRYRSASWLDSCPYARCPSGLTRAPRPNSRRPTRRRPPARRDVFPQGEAEGSATHAAVTLRIAPKSARSAGRWPTTAALRTTPTSARASPPTSAGRRLRHPLGIVEARPSAGGAWRRLAKDLRIWLRARAGAGDEPRARPARRAPVGAS